MYLDHFTLGDLIGWLTGVAVAASALTAAFDRFIKPLIHAKKNSDKALVNADTISRLKDNMCESNRVILKSILAILEHAEDASHTGELSKAKGDIIEYLTHQKTKA